MNSLEAEITLSDRVADACVAAMKLETKSEALTRSEVDIARTKTGVKLKVESDDLHALRAAANTYLRWVIMCNEIAREA